MKGACALALALALLGCREPNKPSVLVTVRYTEGQFSFRQLRVVVRAAQQELAETTVGSKSDGGPLGPGESLRVFLDKQYAGRAVTVRADALDGTGSVVAAREVETAALALDTDTEAIVVLLPVDEFSCPASSPNPTGCCNLTTDTSNGPQASSRNLRSGFPACGAVGKACVACDLIRADTCAGGKCLCGSGPPCAPGVTCVGGGCQCPPQCPACCDASGACQGPSSATCGAGGNACESCRLGAACNPAGVCANAVCLGCGPNQCCSGQGCVPVGLFPRCRTPGTGACTVCDVARSDRCDSETTCRCGTQGPCAENQLCVDSQCVSLAR